MSDKTQIEFHIQATVLCDNYDPKLSPRSGCCYTFRSLVVGDNEEQYVDNALATVQKYGWFVSEDKSTIFCSHCKNYYRPAPAPSAMEAFMAYGANPLHIPSNNSTT